jgi:hypothetical protein
MRIFGLLVTSGNPGKRCLKPIAQQRPNRLCTPQAPRRRKLINPRQHRRRHPHSNQR